jgi:hypothetical protein
MKQFIGKWMTEYPSGDKMILTFTSFGSGLVGTREIIHSEKVIYSMKSLWGYDHNSDKIINAELDPTLPEITVDSCRFISEKRMETNKWVSPNSGDTLRSRYEFQTADLFLFTTINNNRDIETYYFKRVKTSSR